MNLKNYLKKHLKRNKYLFKNIKKFYHFFYNIKLKYLSGSNKDIFTNIYINNKWGDKESFSGSGSNLRQTKVILKSLPNLINKYKIKSFLDIPCGDFYWMKEFNFKDLKYIGADIVREIIDNNNSNYSKKNINFLNLNLISDDLPYADLLFCRDCLVHFSFEDIFKALKNIQKTKCKYFMTTNFYSREINENIPTGSWRTINLCKPPFNFPEPSETIIENCTESENIFSDKVLSLWDIKSIPYF